MTLSTYQCTNVQPILQTVLYWCVSLYVSPDHAIAWLASPYLTQQQLLVGGGQEPHGLARRMCVSATPHLNQSSDVNFIVFYYLYVPHVLEVDGQCLKSLWWKISLQSCQMV